MQLRDRLVRLLDEGNLVELIFEPGHTVYLAKLLYVGQDYVEFEAFDGACDMVAHNIIPIRFLSGVAVTSSYRNRMQLENLLSTSQTEGDREENPSA